jgi:exopolyphosphatase/guanosine-5'-triphosphate,3'-diphosphate pyrophosphatase
MPGFATDDQLLLATLIRGHRRKLSTSVYSNLPGTPVADALRLCALLRFAVLLNRSRVAEVTPRFRVSADGAKVTVSFPEGWLLEHPLTLADLEQERLYQAAVGLALEIDGAPD